MDAFVFTGALRKKTLRPLVIILSDRLPIQPSQQRTSCTIADYTLQIDAKNRVATL